MAIASPALDRPGALPDLPIKLPKLDPASDSAIRKTAQEFEAVFLSELLAPIFEHLETDQLGGGGEGERAFRPLLVQEYAKEFAKAGGIGIADSVTRELLRLQGAERVPEQAPEHAQ